MPIEKQPEFNKRELVEADFEPEYVIGLVFEGERAMDFIGAESTMDPRLNNLRRKFLMAFDRSKYPIAFGYNKERGETSAMVISLAISTDLAELEKMEGEVPKFFKGLLPHFLSGPFIYRVVDW